MIALRAKTLHLDTTTAHILKSYHWKGNVLKAKVIVSSTKENAHLDVKSITSNLTQ